MNKLYLYLLPLSVGSIGVLFTPLNENSTVSYISLALAVILGAIGLQSMVKEKAASLQHQSNVVVASNQAMMQQLEKMEQAFTSVVTKGQSDMNAAMEGIQDKIEDGNKFVESISVLMVQELKRTNQLHEEVTSIQSALQGELSSLHDAITNNQQNAFELIRDLENHVNKLADLQEIVQNHLDNSEASHMQVAQQISSEFATVSSVLEKQTAQLYSQVTLLGEQSTKQVSVATQIIEKTDEIQTQLVQANEQAASTVMTQLKEIKSLNKTLVQGIAQLADSKSAERQQLLKIQKDLIKEYSR